MAGKKSIVKRIIAVFDRSSGKKAEREFAESLGRAGKSGGQKAGKGFLKELRDEFNKRKAQLSEQLARGTINQREFRKQTAIAAKTFNDGLLKGIEKARREGNLTDREYTKLTRSIKRVGDEGERSIGGRLVGSLKRAALAAGAFFGVREVARWVRGSVEAFAEFDLAMQRSISIMGDVDDAMRKKMEQTAREVAKELNISAAQVAEGYFFLASAGLNAAQSVEALPQAATFAKAGAFYLATAVDLLTDAQSALGLTVEDTTANLRNQTRVSDVLVRANTLANATVSQFSEALTNRAGAALKTFNIDVEEGVALLAAYADQGTKGAEAGTNLSRILRLLATAATNNKKQLAALGIELADASGNMLPLADQIENVTNGLRGMSDTQRQAALESIGFTARVQDALLPLLGTSDAIREYESELRKASGTTRDVAGKQMEAFSEQMGRLQQKINDLRIELGQKLAPVLKGVADNFDEIVIALVALTKALAVGGAIYAFTRLAVAIRTVTAATIGLRAAIMGLWASLGPAGWFVVGVTALTEIFRRQGMAAREAARGIDDYMTSLKAMSRAELEEQAAALLKQRDEIQGQIERLTGRRQAKARENLGQVLKAYLEVRRLLDGMDAADAAAAGDSPDTPTVPGTGTDAPADTKFADRKAEIEREIADILRLTEANQRNAEAVRATTEQLDLEAQIRQQTAGLKGAEAEEIAELVRQREAERQALIEAQQVLTQQAHLDSMQRELDLLARRREALQGTKADVQDLARELAIEEAVLRSGAEAGSEYARQVAELAAAHYDASQQVEGAWTAALGAVQEEADLMAGAISGIFNALASGGIGAVAQLAKAKVIENLAWAAENFAKAFGLIAVANPAAAAAAKKAGVGHLAAAAKWSPLAAAGAAIGGGGGGGAAGGAAGPGGFQPSGSISDAANASGPAGPQVHIYIDPLDPHNPAYQRQVGETMRYVRERYGDDFTIHPRSRGGG